MRILEEQDIRDIILGCTLLGTGGGGDPQIGLDILEKDFAQKTPFVLADLSEIPDDAYIASPYVVGSVSPETEADKKKYAAYQEMDMPTPAIAFEKLETYFKKPFYGVISTELGGANTAYALHIGAILRKKIIDGDFAGRSVPGVQHNTCNIFDIPMTPFAIATKYGDAAVFSDIVNEERAEMLLRALSVESNNNVGVVDHPMTGKVLKGSVVPHAISMALQLGQTMRECKENKTHPAKKIVQLFKGKELFEGVVESIDWGTNHGYTEGNIYVNGTDAYEHETYRIWFQNENIIAWKNQIPDATVPDLICVLDEEGDPVTNPNYAKGQKVFIFALPAPALWKTERGLELLGPKSFGFDIEYEGI